MLCSFGVAMRTGQLPALGVFSHVPMGNDTVTVTDVILRSKSPLELMLLIVIAIGACITLLALSAIFGVLVQSKRYCVLVMVNTAASIHDVPTVRPATTR